MISQAVDNPLGRPPGWVTLIAGPMFSGKTETLIRAALRVPVARRAVFKHADDNRYDACHVVSHSGASLEATTARMAGSIELAISADVAWVAIDECQFFGVDIIPVTQRLVARGVRVALAGLDLTSWGEPFPATSALADLADELILRTAHCAVCGRTARFTHRVTPIIDGNLVGGPEAFEPRCADCWRAPVQTPFDPALARLPVPPVQSHPGQSAPAKRPELERVRLDRPSA